MKQYVNLFRMRRGDQGTQGMLYSDDYACYTLELPWRENQKNISSIPAGKYECKIRVSPKYGKIYWVTEVDGRTYILIHAGNWAGDKEKGFKSNVNGCILLGKKKGLLSKQWAVLNSRVAIREFMDKMGWEPFTLHIHEAF